MSVNENRKESISTQRMRV